MEIKVAPESFLCKVADYLMLPVMYLLQGTLREVPQRTHFWNNTKYPNSSLRHLQAEMLISVPGDEQARKRWLGPVPLFHMPFFGGWKNFVVIAPKVNQDIWYIGWVVGDTLGISNISLSDGVRLLQGPSPAQFFGLNEHSEQIQLEILGMGKLGTNHKFSNIPLL